jgi:dipeptidyl aminopeptidase/acylaminoacyl peptidase
MKRSLSLFLGLLLVQMLSAQPALVVPDNLVTENIPLIQSSLVEEVKNFTESRSAYFVDWHPLKKEMLIMTRFANSNQLHYVRFPGGDRKQITFFEDAVGSTSFEPLKGDYFLFSRDIGGNEFAQIYRFDMVSGKSTLLTDGKRSQNGGFNWSSKKDKIAYWSTKRNGKDRDIYIMDPLNPAAEKLIVENAGGGWGIADWSKDDTKLLIEERISVNEIRIYILDIATGVKARILPEQDERTVYNSVSFINDDKGIYLLTTKDNEFNRLAYYELASKKLTFITTSIPWSIEGVTLSEDKAKMIFITNENGLSKIYLLNTADNKYAPIEGLPAGTIGGAKFTNDGKSISITAATYNSSSDVYEYIFATKKIIRWTESETGGMDVSSLSQPELITWKSFDGKMISGYLYKATPKFTGKRPVIIQIHGGPEAQSRPVFIGRSNYYLNELGISIIFPNVRGSTGYGKTFTDLDNGMKREESVKDIGALFDWIAQQPTLDKERVMVTGGSYGGYMTLAVAATYNDKIKCALDVVGISNFNTFLKNTESYRRDLRRVEYGDERDPEMSAFLEKISPLNHTGKIKKPMFIVQGQNDPRVPYTEAVQMKDKIKENGGTVWFLMAKDEGHGFRKKNNSDFQFYATIEFIKKYLVE